MGSKYSPQSHKAQEVGRLVGGGTVGRPEKAVLLAGFGRMSRISQTQDCNGSDNPQVRSLNQDFQVLDHLRVMRPWTSHSLA